MSFDGRLLELGAYQYKPLFHDLLKTLSIMMCIEIGQRYFLPQVYLDGVYHIMMLFILVGQVVFHLILDKLIGAGGPTSMCCPFLGLRERSAASKEADDVATDSVVSTGADDVAAVDAGPIRMEDAREPEPFGAWS